jgi:hypothetical protein
VLFALPVEALGFDAAETFVEWSGSYLAPGLAVVTLGGEGQAEEEWFDYYLIGMRTGALSDEIAVEDQPVPSWCPWATVHGSPTVPTAALSAGRALSCLPHRRTRKVESSGLAIFVSGDREAAVGHLVTSRVPRL